VLRCSLLLAITTPPKQSQACELDNAVVHLLRSNTELETALAEMGPDTDFEDAIRENLEVIASKRALAVSAL
jgi:hypothetical protein